MAQVKQLARALNWNVYHTRQSIGSDRGFPDLVCVRAGVLHALELKTMRGRLELEQAAWLADLAAVTRVTAGVYRPSDWEAIEGLLKGDG